MDQRLFKRRKKMIPSEVEICIHGSVTMACQIEPIGAATPNSPVPLLLPISATVDQHLFDDRREDKWFQCSLLEDEASHKSRLFQYFRYARE